MSENLQQQSSTSPDGGAPNNVSETRRINRETPSVKQLSEKERQAALELSQLLIVSSNPTLREAFRLSRNHFAALPPQTKGELCEHMEITPLAESYTQSDGRRRVRIYRHFPELPALFRDLVQAVILFLAVQERSRKMLSTAREKRYQLILENLGMTVGDSEAAATVRNMTLTIGELTNVMRVNIGMFPLRFLGHQRKAEEQGESTQTTEDLQASSLESYFEELAQSELSVPEKGENGNATEVMPDSESPGSEASPQEGKGKGRK